MPHTEELVKVVSDSPLSLDALLSEISDLRDELDGARRWNELLEDEVDALRMLLGLAEIPH